jgi:hypothetical protein
MMSKLEKEVRFLKIYAVVTTLLFAVLVFSAFQQANQKNKFTELDVERINIVEKDGKLKMVISNSERQHPGIIDGKTLSRQRPAGMLFFNDRGDECGGLSFNGDQKDGKVAQARCSLSIGSSKIKLLGCSMVKATGSTMQVLRVWDRPKLRSAR